MATLVDSYSESNQSTGNSNLVSQSFTGNGGVLQSAKFYLEKQGSPVGTVWAEIYAHSGTFGTSSIPTGSALATSGTIDVSTIDTSYELVEFTFTGGEKITLTNTTKYCLVIGRDHTSGSPNYLWCGVDGTSATHAGNESNYSDPTWWPQTGWDVCFYVYSDASSASTTPSASISSTPSSTPSLTISSSESASPSSSPSASASITPSASPSVTQSASPSVTPSSSDSPSPSTAPPKVMKLRVAKEGYDAITEQDPNNLIFDSEYETLKYHLSGTVDIEAVVDELDQTFKGSYEHGLGYIPYFEAYVKEIDGSTYKPVPFMTTGASTAIWYRAYAGSTHIYFEVRMMSYVFDTYDIEFKYFIFKNDLGV